MEKIDDHHLWVRERLNEVKRDIRYRDYRGNRFKDRRDVIDIIWTIMETGISPDMPGFMEQTLPALRAKGYYPAIVERVWRSQNPSVMAAIVKR